MSLQELEIRLFTDFEFAARLLIKIVDKSTGRLVPLVLNRAQKIVYEEILRQLKETGHVRLLLPKYRQGGISTLIEAYLYWLTTVNFRWTSLVVSHDRDSSDHIFGMTERIYDNVPPEIKPETLSRRQGRRITFNNKSKTGLDSKIIVKVAKDVGGRSFTVNAMHLSEVTTMPNWKKFKQFLNATAASMPTNRPSFIFIETTGQGPGDHFHKLVEDSLAGRNDYKTLFLNWLLDDTYKRSIVNDEEREELFNSLDNYERYDGEIDLHDNYGATLENIKWRRWTIDNVCGGDLLLYRREFPLTLDDVFTDTGSTIFDGQKLKKLYTWAKSEVKKAERGNLVWDDETESVKWELNNRGRWWIWEHPEPGKKFHSAWDSAMGTLKGDFSAGLVVNERMWDVAVYHARIGTDLFAQDIFLTQQYYNNHLVVPEFNYPGNGTIQDLKRLTSKIYTRQSNKGKLVEKETDLVGWWTNAATKPELIATMHKCIRDDLGFMRDDMGVWELMIYQEKDNGEIGAPAGSHDDRATARMICYHTFPHGKMKFEGDTNMKPVYQNYDHKMIIDPSELPQPASKTMIRSWSFRKGLVLLTGYISASGHYVVTNEMVDTGADVITNMTALLAQTAVAFKDWSILDVGDEDKRKIDKDENIIVNMSDKIEMQFGINIERTTSDHFQRIQAVDHKLATRLSGLPGILISSKCPTIIEGFEGEYKRIVNNGVPSLPVKGKHESVHYALQSLVLFLDDFDNLKYGDSLPTVTQA